MKDPKKIQAWAEKTGNKLLTPVFKGLDGVYGNRSDEEIMEVCNHMMTALVHRMIVDSLSIREEELDGREDSELMQLVSAKFQMTKLAIESGVTAAFEQAMVEATKQYLEYQCKISRVSDPVNSLPC